MSDPSLGTWLRRERERRGVSLKSIAEQTKVAVPLLEGLEGDDLARWPGGIYRRAFVRAYAVAVGLDPDEVMQRFEREHPAVEPGEAGKAAHLAVPPAEQGETQPRPRVVTTSRPPSAVPSKRSRAIGTAADLTVALVLALGSAAAGSRLLWPVLLIAAYYALGVLLTGTSPMVALLSDQPSAPSGEEARPHAPDPARPAPERRGHPTRRTPTRPPRPARANRPRVQ